MSKKIKALLTVALLTLSVGLASAVSPVIGVISDLPQMSDKFLSFFTNI